MVSGVVSNLDLILTIAHYVRYSDRVPLPLRLRLK